MTKTCGDAAALTVEKRVPHFARNGRKRSSRKDRRGFIRCAQNGKATVKKGRSGSDGCGGASEKSKHGLIAGVWRLLEGDVADTGEDDQAGVEKNALEMAGGVETDGAILVAPDEEGGLPGYGRESGAEAGHVCGPAADDAEDVVDGSADFEAGGIAFEGISGHAGGIAIHSAESDGFGPAGKGWDELGE